MMKNFLLVLLTTILMSPSVTMAKDVVYWQNINWPPLQILRGENAGKGRFDIIIKLFQNQLPQYEHKNVEMNWARYWEELKSGKHILNSMAIKTDGRLPYTVFSKAVAFTLPHRIIMKKSMIAQIGNPESVVLSTFFKEGRINGILEKTRSYGVKLDEIIKKYETAANFNRQALEIEHLIRMIISDRIHYTIEYPFVVEYMVKTYRLPDDILGSIRIEELPRYVVGHVAAPRNNWGINMINEINPVIDKLTKTRQYIEINKMWHSDKSELNQIQEIYQELFLE